MIITPEIIIETQPVAEKIKPQKIPFSEFHRKPVPIESPKKKIDIPSEPLKEDPILPQKKEEAISIDKKPKEIEKKPKEKPKETPKENPKEKKPPPKKLPKETSVTPPKQALINLDKNKSKATTQNNNGATDDDTPSKSEHSENIMHKVEKCWAIPPNTLTSNFKVKVKLDMNKDGSIKNAKLLASNTELNDSSFAAFAQSALNAVLDPRCASFDLDPAKYSEWKTIVLSFSTEGMM